MEHVNGPAVLVLANAALHELWQALDLTVLIDDLPKMSIQGHGVPGGIEAMVGDVPESATLPGGTAFHSDAGMCGDYNSVIGMDKLEPMRRFVTGMGKDRFTPANGEATLSGVFVETDDRTGKAVRVVPVRLGGRLAEARP